MQIDRIEAAVMEYQNFRFARDDLLRKIEPLLPDGLRPKFRKMINDHYNPLIEDAKLRVSAFG